MIVKILQQKVIKILVSGELKHPLYFCILLFSSMTMPVNAQSEVVGNEPAKIDPALQYQVKFKARDGHDFLLAADYLFFPNKASEKNMPGVIVLHDCHSDRKKYKILTTSIAEQGLHTLSLDFRGYGASIAEGYSELAVKKHAADIISYQTELAVLTSYWLEDLLAAYKFLRKKVDNSKGISIVASGCAGSYAVALSEKVHLNSMVLLTPDMTYADKERYKNLVDIPSYFVSSAQHAMSYATTQELFTWNGATHSKLQVYKGDKLSSQIINSHKYLVNDIALWLKFTLR
jgi:hypothetical protein